MKNIYLTDAGGYEIIPDTAFTEPTVDSGLCLNLSLLCFIIFAYSFTLVCQTRVNVQLLGKIGNRDEISLDYFDYVMDFLLRNHNLSNVSFKSENYVHSTTHLSNIPSHEMDRHIAHFEMN